MLLSPSPIEPADVNLPVAGSYSSALARTESFAVRPPRISTRPSASSVAVWSQRPNFIEPVRLNVPVAGS